MGYTLTVRNGQIVGDNGRLTKKDIGISGRYIEGIDTGLKSEKEIDASDMIVVPGFIDIHMHGIGFEAVTSGDLSEIAHLEASQGASTFIAALFGPPDESIENLHRHLKDTDNLNALPQVAGFRLESPYLGYTGAGIPRDLAPITRKLTNSLLEASNGHILIWDVSPEIDHAAEEIAFLSSQGIVCSLAHTRATIRQAKQAVDAGARLVTHLFDTFEVPKMTDPGVYPVSLLDYCLVEDRLSCEIIGDGTHAHPILVEKAFRCKGNARTIFVTDSNLGAGLPDGDYDLPGGWGRARVAGSNQGVRLIEREMGLAGSALTPAGSFKNAVNMFGKSIAEASELCSHNPAKLLGLNKGNIIPGYDADLVILDSEFNVQWTIVNGQVIYAA